MLQTSLNLNTLAFDMVNKGLTPWGKSCTPTLQMQQLLEEVKGCIMHVDVVGY